MFDHILLEKEQERLLIEIVEFERNIPRDRRQKFSVIGSGDSDKLSYPGYPSLHKKIFSGDIETLARENLVDLTHVSSGTIKFYITPMGFRYYEYLKQKLGQPIDKLQVTVKDYLSGDEFAANYPAAYQKWMDADNLLWQSDSEKQYTTIGHLCRESLQEFANYLIEKYCPDFGDKTKAHDIARIKAVLDLLSTRLGKTEKSFLDALLTYWGTVSDLAQRQEHGGQKEGKPLVWEDARRIVFQVAMLMFEIDKSLAKIG